MGNKMETEVQKQRIHRGASFVALLAATTTMSPIGPVTAQTTSQRTQVALEEIVVTTRKRAENLQTVPLSITALTADTMERTGVTNLRDISYLTAGLTVGGDDTERNAVPTIRGLSFSGDRGSEGNVAVFLDGVYIANTGAVSLGIMDFERVEVVKGPQSALYGRNAFAGAINYVSKAPGEELESRFEIVAGSDKTYRVEAAVGGSIVDDKLRARLSVGYDRFGGTWKDPVNNKALGGHTKRGVALAMVATPTDMITVDTGFYYGNDEFGLPTRGNLDFNCAQLVANGPFTAYCGALPDGNNLPALEAPNQLPSDATGNNRTVVHGRVKTTVDFDTTTFEVLLGYFDIKQRDYYELNAKARWLSL